MRACFAEYFRIIKPGRWMNVKFHNSANTVYNAIQEVLQIVARRSGLSPESLYLVELYGCLLRATLCR